MSFLSLSLSAFDNLQVIIRLGRGEQLAASESTFSLEPLDPREATCENVYTSHFSAEPDSFLSNIPSTVHFLAGHDERGPLLKVFISKIRESIHFPPQSSVVASPDSYFCTESTHSTDVPRSPVPPPIASANGIAPLQHDARLDSATLYDIFVANSMPLDDTRGTRSSSDLSHKKLDVDSAHAWLSFDDHSSTLFSQGPDNTPPEEGLDPVNHTIFGLPTPPLSILDSASNSPGPLISSPAQISYASFCNLTPSSSATSISGGTHSTKGNTKRRRFQCEFPGCSRRFTSQYTLKVHTDAHRTKPRPFFPCTLSCKEIFSRQHDRLRHEVSRHGKVSEWTCKDCRRFFSSHRTFKNHKCPVETNPAVGMQWTEC